MNGTLSFYEYRLSGGDRRGGDTQTLSLNSFELFTLIGSRGAKTSLR